MGKIAIVYWSGTGNTEAMANFIAEGAQGAGAEVEMFTPGDFSADKVAEYEKIAFGCPSMGAEQLEEAEFEPMFEDVKGSLSGKKVALFGSYGWGNGEWMDDWAADCKDIGVNLVAEPLIVNEMPEGSDEDECRSLGDTIARS